MSVRIPNNMRRVLPSGVSFYRMRTTLCCVLLAAGFVLKASAGESLEEKLAPLVKAHEGRVAVAVKQLKTGESFSHNADQPMPTASLIKLAVVVEAYRQADAEQVDLQRLITLRQEDKVPGSGILT